MTRPPRGTAQHGQINMYRCKSAPITVQHRQQTTTGTGNCLLHQRSADTGMGTDPRRWKWREMLKGSWIPPDPSSQALRGCGTAELGKSQLWEHKRGKTHCVSITHEIHVWLSLDCFFSFLTLLTRALQHTEDRQGRRMLGQGWGKIGSLNYCSTDHPKLRHSGAANKTSDKMDY